MRRDQYIGMQFKKTDSAMKTRVNSIMKPYDLTEAQARIIIFLAENSSRELHQKDIEKKFSLKHPTVTGILKRLETKGFVKCINSQTDKRFKIITLTDKSRNIYVEILDKLYQLEEDMIRGMDDEEIAALHSSLKTLMKNCNPQ